MNLAKRCPILQVGRGADASDARAEPTNQSSRRADPITFYLPIDERFRVTADERCWRIEQRRKDAEWRPVEYHASIEAAVNSLSGRLLRTSEVRTLAECLGCGGKRRTHAYAGPRTTLHGGGAP